MVSLGLWREALAEEIPRGNWERHGDLVLLAESHLRSAEWAAAAEHVWPVLSSFLGRRLGY